ncbi:hypothetical protein LCGC14_1299330 [marine sediment metagenome]|uniref:Uncharacterized protein n=1 Tax=marine sediment metagenome TaxID=412755 RepID=A0A0F9LAQ3_9ZZZZ
MPGDIEALGTWAKDPRQAGINPISRLDHPFTLDGLKYGEEEQALSSGTNWYVRPPSGTSYEIMRMNIVALDTNFNNALHYGGINPLPTGIVLRLWDEGTDTEVYDFTPMRITRIHDWAAYGGVDSVVRDASLADAYMCRWTFAKGVAPILVDGSDLHVLRMEIPDPLDHLLSQVVMVQGWQYLSEPD